jgi:hypothetical protein
MKVLQVALLSVLLIVAGFVLALAGFWVIAPAARTGLQVLAVLALAGAIVLGRQALAQAQRMLDEA